jgi:signal transduction histidine kinase
MPLKNIKIDKERIEYLLDQFQERTGLSLSIYLAGNNEPIYSKKGWPKFCRMICDLDHFVCTGMVPRSDKLQNCDAGLWCRPIKIIIEDDCVGYFVVGHRRIDDNDFEARKKLKIFLKESCWDLLRRDWLVEMYNNVDPVDEKAFFSDEVEKLKDTSNDFIIEIKIAKRLTELENSLLISASRARHVIYQPLQSLISISSILSNEINEPELKNLSIKLKEELKKLYFDLGPLNNINYNEVSSRYNFTKVDFISIINDTIELFRNEAKSKDLDINDIKVYGLPIDYIEASEPHFKQIIFNLIENSVKYSYSSSKFSQRYISVKCTSYLNYLCIEITNYGVGIAEYEIKQGLIFRDGYRGIFTWDRGRIGSGLGLGVARKYIIDHGGKIIIKSTNVGEEAKYNPYKTTVEVYLPFTQRK